MQNSLNVLIVEDYLSDAQLLIAELQQAGYEAHYRRVDTVEEMHQALDEQPWDIILSDYSLPRFSAPEALKTIQECGVDVPVIIISGTVGEETAVECMRAGASDFMSKNNLPRLIPAIERELREKKVRDARHKAEADLHESEDRFRTMANVAPIMIWTIDQNGYITYTNQKFSDVTGIQVGKTDAPIQWQQFHHPDNFEHFEANLLRSPKQREGFSIEHQIKDKHGEYLWFFTTTAPRFSYDGDYIGLIGSSMDITARRKAEEELKSRSRQQEVVTELGLDALNGLDLNTLIQKSMHLISENLQVEYCTFLELEPNHKELRVVAGIGWGKDVIGKACIPVEVNTHVGYSLLSREPVMFEDLTQETRFIDFDLLNAEGIRSGMSVVLYVHNQPYGILCVHCKRKRRFNTNEQHFLQAMANVLAATLERQDTENALMESEARFRTVADTAPVIIWMSNDTREIIFVNKSMEEFTGHRFEFGDTLDLTQNMHPDDLPWVQEILSDTFERKLPFEIELRIKRQDEQYRWLLTTGVPRYSSEGQFLGYIGSAIDITERKKVEESLLSYANRLELSNRELEDFATIASHDLQAPLRKIITFSDLLRTEAEGKLTPESVEYIERIQRASGRMQALITDLLILSRVTRKAHPFAPTDLNQVIAEVLEDLELTIQETHANIQLQNLCTIDADISQMKQAFANLIGNSLKFIKPGVRPEITITSTLKDNQCKIIIADNGIGFETQFNERIFKVFERLHGNSVYPGTGIGLTIVRKIIGRHHGTIIGQGVPGKGSTFTITLLRKQEMG